MNLRKLAQAAALGRPRAARRDRPSLRRGCWLPCLALWASCLWATPAGAQPAGTRIEAGSSLPLLAVWPALGEAPPAAVATVECWIRPDRAALSRPRSFLLTLSNRGGADRAGISLTLRAGKVRANVLGTFLEATQPLMPDQWTHVAVTIDTETVNKQARLWIDGKRAGSQLVLEPWPDSFEVARMLSDFWGLGRNFSGELGDVRFSSKVRYRADFQPPSRLREDGETAKLWLGTKLPLTSAGN